MPRTGFSLFEMLLALAITVVATMATLSFVWVPRERVAARACELRQAELQLRAEEYYRGRGQWPSSNMQELSSAAYSIPICPVDGQSYRFNPATQQVESHGHEHP